MSILSSSSAVLIYAMDDHGLPYCETPLPLRGRRRGRVFSDTEEQSIADAYLSDPALTHCKLAQRVGVSDGTIRNILKRQRVKSRPSGTKGSDHRSWNGGRTIRDGYEHTWIPDTHPYASMRAFKSYVRTHRLRMAEALGRPLRDDETVHHVDGDRLNNDLSNLQLRTGQHGAGISYRCLSCGSVNIAPTHIA